MASYDPDNLAQSCPSMTAERQREARPDVVVALAFAIRRAVERERKDEVTRPIIVAQEEAKAA
jgi:hypothetical protein